MSLRATHFILTLILCLFLTPAIAAKNAMVDYPLFTVLDGFIQKSGKSEKFAAFTFKTGPESADKVTVEGRYYDLRYTLNKGAEAPGKLHVLRNFGEAVKQVGGTVLFEKHDNAYFRLEQNGKEIWVRLQSAANGAYYYLYIIEKTAMTQEVKINPVLDALDATGKAVVYITFDTGSAAIKPESAPVIADIQDMLTKRPDLRVSIEGHTDNDGTPEANQKLSEDRAEAVKARLAELGIATERMTSLGHGQTKPIADNGTEDGKAKNRRVELVKISG